MITLKDTRTIRKPGDIVIPNGMTRVIKYIVLHCTAGPQNQPLQEILNYWKNVNKWKSPGYHFEINAAGVITELFNISKVANGVAGYNTNSIHISYTGGVDSKGKAIDNRTEGQKESQILLIKRLKDLFPNAIVLGHRDFPNVQKECPSFDVRDWLSEVGLDKKATPSKIIYKLNQPLIKNDTVKAIQKALGMCDDADGIFGSDTDKAVRAFQTKNKLTPDGVVGPKTAELLKVKL